MKVAKCLHNSLSDLLYAFDEPSAGLHPHDVTLLADAFRTLCDRGNTVLIVEHDREVIALADHVVEIGPGAGTDGGRVTFDGNFGELESSDTVTGRALRQRPAIKAEPRVPADWLTVENASLHNLKNVTIAFPVGVMSCVTGVAGSGKTSLTKVFAEAYPEAVRVSQKELGGNTRSTPATYLGILDPVRDMFARANGVAPAYFSYNSRGGCPVCKGKGIIVSDMAFMDAVTTVCGECGGKRYSHAVLDYRYNGLNILEVLDMSTAEALRFFGEAPFTRPLAALVRVGLGYLRLNQSLSTLSGGEAQRVKLARRLDGNAGILILDEPTSGLHMTDTTKLLNVFDMLMEAGNTLVVIEHDPDVIRRADWVIDMGPGGGDAGGRVVYAGPPTGLATCMDSVSGRFVGGGERSDADGKNKNLSQ